MLRGAANKRGTVFSLLPELFDLLPQNLTTFLLALSTIFCFVFLRGPISNCQEKIMNFYRGGHLDRSFLI